MLANTAFNTEGTENPEEMTAITPLVSFSVASVFSVLKAFLADG
jgi:hypothetical protein